MTIAAFHFPEDVLLVIRNGIYEYQVHVHRFCIYAGMNAFFLTRIHKAGTDESPERYSLGSLSFDNAGYGAYNIASQLEAVLQSQET